MVGRDAPKNSIHANIEHRAELEEAKKKPGPGNYNATFDTISTKRRDPSFSMGKGVRDDIPGKLKQKSTAPVGTYSPDFMRT